MPDLRTLISTWPKADLHVHLEGSVSPSTLSELSNRHNCSLDSPVVLGSFGEIKPPPGIGSADLKLRDFKDFIGVYVKISQLIQNEEDIILVIDRYAQSAINQGIKYSELYFSPSTFCLLNRNLDSLFVGLREGEKHAQKKYNLKIRWIFDIVRNQLTDGFDTLGYAQKARALGADVAAIGLGGYEKPGDCSGFVKAFVEARRLGFNTLAHAGELEGPQNIKDAIDLLKPSRIGHGISVAQDQTLMQEVCNLQIPFEVCPWSNVFLNITTMANHPVAKLIDAGLNVVICSDDPGIFEKDLVDNYLLAADLGASTVDLERMAAKSLSLI